MSNTDWNISANERLSRGVLGIVLLVGAALGLAKLFAVLIAIGLIGTAALGKCGIPRCMSCFKSWCDQCCSKKGSCGMPGNSDDTTPKS